MRPQDELRLLTDHYDALIAENNDPVLDPPTLAAYMERWDGAPFMELLSLDGWRAGWHRDAGILPASTFPPPLSHAHGHICPAAATRPCCAAIS